MTRTTLLLALLLAGGARAGVDDVVPQAIEALLALPKDPFLAPPAPAMGSSALFELEADGTARALCGLPDVSGDGAPDLCVGWGPGAARPLQALDAALGTSLWTAGPAGASVRSLRGLAARDGRVAAGLCGPVARVELRLASGGQLLWARDLSTGPDPANVLSVELVDDLDGDGLCEVLCAGGAGVEAALLLSGADGATLWSHAAGSSVADARAVPDHSGDGIADVLAVGGLLAPFARLLSGADGSALWDAALPGPGSCGLAGPDISGDGLPDVLAGFFAAPQACLLALSGADGAPLWTAPYVRGGVTMLAPLSDVDGDGLHEVAVGSLENAMACVRTSDGQLQWRFESMPIGSGAMPCAVPLGDTDGNGSIDVLSASFDQRLYVLDGRIGVPLLLQNLRARGVAAAALSGGSDGHPELAAGGAGRVAVYDGGGGIVSGPVVDPKLPGKLQAETQVAVWAYPTSTTWTLASFAPPWSLVVPGFSGVLEIDLTAFEVAAAGKVPGAGGLTFNIPPLPRELLGLLLRMQAVTVLSPGHGLIGPSKTWVIGG
jgi:outer membrane protein assembly factor BamB